MWVRLLTSRGCVRDGPEGIKYSGKVGDMRVLVKEVVLELVGVSIPLVWGLRQPSRMAAKGWPVSEIP